MSPENLIGSGLGGSPESHREKEKFPRGWDPARVPELGRLNLRSQGQSQVGSCKKTSACFRSPLGAISWPGGPDSMPPLSRADSPCKKQPQSLPSCPSEQRAKAAAPSPTPSRRLQEVNPSYAGRKEANWQLSQAAASPNKPPPQKRRGQSYP